MISEYDDKGRIFKRSEPILKNSVLVGKKNTEYIYDINGKLKETIVTKYNNSGILIEKNTYNYNKTGSLK